MRFSSRIGRWAGRGTMAVLDQGLFAGSHFVLNILLARWLPPSEYGAFAIAYSSFLLVAAFHHALLVEPMMVFGAGRFTNAFPQYLGRLLRIHSVFIPLFGLLALVGAVLWVHTGGDPFAGALLGLATSGLFVLLLTLLRRAHFTQMRPAWSAVGGACYAIVLLGTILLLAGWGIVSPLSAFLAMGGASFVTTLLLLVPIRFRSDGPGTGPNLREIAWEHWKYGRWALATVVPMWVSGNVYYLVIPIWIGLHGAGEFRAVVNFAMPALHSLMAISLILLPHFVRIREERGVEGLNRPAKRLLLLFALFIVAYVALLVPLGDRAVRLLYAGQYEEFGPWSMLLVGCIPLAGTLGYVFAGLLRAAERPDLVFRGHMVAGVTALVAGVPLVRFGGVNGGLVAMLVSTLLGGVMMFELYKNRVATGSEAARHWT